MAHDFSLQSIGAVHFGPVAGKTVWWRVVVEQAAHLMVAGKQRKRRNGSQDPLEGHAPSNPTSFLRASHPKISFPYQ